MFELYADALNKKSIAICKLRSIAIDAKNNKKLSKNYEIDLKNYYKLLNSSPNTLCEIIKKTGFTKQQVEKYCKKMGEMGISVLCEFNKFHGKNGAVLVTVI